MDRIKRALKELAEFDFTVPVDYNHDTLVETFIDGFPPGKCSEEFTAKNFVGASTKLIAGRTYMVKVFKILTPSKNTQAFTSGWDFTGKDVLSYLKSQKGVVLAGIRGLILAYQFKENELPNCGFTSFDEQDFLYREPSFLRAAKLPAIWKKEDGVTLQTTFLENEMSRNYFGTNAIICFFEK